METFKGYILRKNDDKESVSGKIETLPFSYLKKRDLLIKIHYSSINYKDYLATKENGGVIFTYPIVPGIDLAGEVISSNTPEFEVGDFILATSYDLGTKTDGGLAEYATIDKSWAILLPKELSLKEAMLLGTAGFTAALAIQKLLQHGIKKEDSIAITGATGGVGSLASLILEKLGFQNVTLYSQKVENPYLHQLPYQHLASSQKLVEGKKKALDKQEFQGVIDTVGGDVLSHLLPKISYNGAVCAVGNAGGIALQTTVLPFILRNITLYGIDSVHTPYPLRQNIWSFLANDGKIDFTKLHTTEIPFSNLTEAFTLFENKEQLGRILISF